MAERKHKRESEGLTEFNPEESGFVLEPAQVEVGSGYTVSVRYDENEKPIIDVKTYGEVDITKLRREIERAFPNAQIRRLKQAQSVTIVKKRKRKNRIKRNKI
jgi:hypothetical protein